MDCWRARFSRRAQAAIPMHGKMTSELMMMTGHASPMLMTSIAAVIISWTPAAIIAESRHSRNETADVSTTANTTGMFAANIIPPVWSSPPDRSKMTVNQPNAIAQAAATVVSSAVPRDRDFTLVEHFVLGGAYGFVSGSVVTNSFLLQSWDKHTAYRSKSYSKNSNRRTKNLLRHWRKIGKLICCTAAGWQGRIFDSTNSRGKP
ncbi:hypothetical protein K227x_28700 [Rubripirellula lacrimiformis]|uniref:Uncharacterized protein n=1 Tax=Rubripirellula lacrimiformis TaxID=1930273 RepID=A0A517NBF9_9BACT|nr:hypothetical protein K227x_28700 [Rubripirellula lacrimiformis]